MKYEAFFHSRIQFLLIPTLMVVFFFGSAKSVFADTHYVDATSCTKGRCTGEPVIASPPYTTWATAAGTIDDAIGEASSGDTVKVKAVLTYSGFAMKDGVDVEAEFIGVDYPLVTTAIDFNGDFPIGARVEGFEVDGAAISVYFSAISATGIDNNTILRNCILHDGGKAGIKVEGGAPIIEDNVIYNKNYTGIRIMNPVGSATQALIIRGNELYNNGLAGSRGSGIFFDTVTGSDVRYVLIQNNLIHDTFNKAGISFETSENYVYITGNEIYSNAMAGIHVINPITGTVTISGETNFTFAGTSYTNGSPNDIHSNTRGGITMEESSTMVITSNRIRDNLWGGIHTGKDQIADGAGFTGAGGSAVLTIRKNRVYGNGKALDTYGGGIDVRHASGTIENNMVYENKRAGIRFGDHITAIKNNTVVSNGDELLIRGGGIIYDDLAGAVDDAAAGQSPAAIPIQNNITTLNATAGIRDGYCQSIKPVLNTLRDYNLLYMNNQWKYTNPTFPPPNLGGCWDNINEQFTDPLFKDMGADDYRLQRISEGDANDSPGLNAGSDATDLGAWGGTYPLDW